MEIEGDMAVGGNDVIAGKALARLDSDRMEPGLRKPLEEGVGQDVARAAGEEYPVRKRPLQLGNPFHVAFRIEHRGYPLPWNHDPIVLYAAVFRH